MRRTHRSQVVLALCVLLLLTAGACRSRKPTAVIAKVGDAMLTMEEAREHLDSTQRSTLDDQLRAYVAHWVNTQLLYQEAQKNGVERTDNFSKKLQDAKAQLAVDAYLDQLYQADSLSSGNEDTVKAYYNAHQSEFFVNDDAVKLNLITFDTRERASAFHNRVLAGTSWAAALDSGDQPMARAAVEAVWFTQRTLFPAELWRVAQNLGLNDVSFPVKTGLGFSVVQLLGRAQKGDAASYDLARDDASQRVTIEQRRRRYQDLMGNLRKRYTVQILLDFKPSPDSGRISHE